MSRTYVKLMPKTPLFKKNTFEIPKSYSKQYKSAGIVEELEQTILFHATQFGGFRKEKIDDYFNEKFLNKWFTKKYENGFYKLKANSKFVKKFGNIELESLKRKSSKFMEPYFEGVFEQKLTDLISEYESQENIPETEITNLLNNAYKRLKIEIEIPKSGITFEDRIELSKLEETPQFATKENAGNRMYQIGKGGTSYQRMSSSLRTFLTINGLKTSELDISAASLNFMEESITKQLRKIIEKDTEEDQYNIILKIFMNKHHEEFKEIYKKVPKDYLIEGIKKTIDSMKLCNGINDDFENEHEIEMKTLYEEIVGKNNTEKYEKQIEEEYNSKEKIEKLKEKIEEENKKRKKFLKNVKNYKKLGEYAKKALRQKVFQKAYMGKSIEESKYNTKSIWDYLKKDYFETEQNGKTLFKIIREKDPYQHFIKNSSVKLEREFVKTMLYTLIYSRTEYEKNNFNRKLKDAKINYSFDKFKEEFPSIYARINLLKSMSDEKPHNQIFQEESDFAREVLIQSQIIEEIPTIHIHDSFITQRKHSKRLEEIINEVSEKKYDRRLPLKKKY